MVTLGVCELPIGASVARMPSLSVALLNAFPDSFFLGIGPQKLQMPPELINLRKRKCYNFMPETRNPNQRKRTSVPPPSTSVVTSTRDAAAPIVMSVKRSRCENWDEDEVYHATDTAIPCHCDPYLEYPHAQ